jgi:hypothetical protein
MATLLASDNFASGSLAAGWGTMPIFPSGMCQVVNAPPMVTEAKVLSTSYGQMWTGLTWPNDQICEVTIQAFTLADANNSIYLLVRAQNATDSSYLANFYSSGGTSWSLVLTRRDNGAVTTLAGPITLAAISSGDVLRLAATGANLHVYQNGVRLAYAADATYASGTPAFGQYTTTALTHNQISSWRGYSGVLQPVGSGLVSLGKIIVFAAGTPVPVSAVPFNCNTAYFTTLNGQSGQQMYIGIAGLTKATLAGALKVLQKPLATPATEDTWVLTHSAAQGAIDLNKIFIDADTSGDALLVSAEV